jgi:hypothetical protein
MGKRVARSLVLVPAILVLMVGTALALDQTNGTGKTHNDATIGFNAKKDLSGEITYLTDDDSGFVVYCREGLTSYRNLRPTPRGYLRTKVIAICTDAPPGQDGNTVYVEIYFVDRGEPGDRDIIRFFASYDPNFADNPNGDPNVWLTQCNTGEDIEAAGGCMDAGIITNGNVQIHQDPDPTLSETVVIGPNAVV